MIKKTRDRSASSKNTLLLQKIAVLIRDYPPGQHADIQTEAATPEMKERISSLPLPDTDPLFGSTGNLLEAWR